MNLRRTVFACAAAAALLASSAALAQTAGTLQTLDAGGAVRSTFDTASDVFLAVGSAATPCQSFDYLGDGLYYFQVTDASGRLLSTDPVSSREFRVTHGVLDTSPPTAPPGTPPPPAVHKHAVGASTACGSSSLALEPFDRAAAGEASYLVWVTPVSAFVGASVDVADPACITLVPAADCFHGFRSTASRVLAFRVEDQRNCQPTFCVSGAKFADTNGNGLRDSGENGIPGVTITVVRTDASGPAIPLTGLTGADGSYRICGLTHDGTFRVTESVPSGYSQTGPLDRRLSRRVRARDFGYDVITCDADYGGLDFGNQLLPNAIGGVKFEDLNANGTRDPGEPPVAGVTINLYPGVPPNPAGSSRQAVTDANGNFLFTNVTPGPFFLTETPPTGFTPTTPGSGFIAGTLASGGSILNGVFGNFRGVLTGSISGTKFIDTNGNGAQDAGEGPQSGVTITISGPPGFTARSVQTDANGAFSFTGVPFGTYTVAETVPPGYEQSLPAGNGTLTATVGVGSQNVTGLLFGNHPLPAPSSIAGTKFLDINGNGVKDPGDGGLSGVTIVLHGPGGAGTPVMTTTDSNGAYIFNGLAPGTYTLTENVPAGYTQTAPAGGTWTVTLGAGENRTGVNFGNASNTPVAGSIIGIKYLDLNVNGIVDGFDHPIGGITMVLTASDGTTQQQVTADDGTFHFDNLAPGTYVLTEILPPNFFQTFPGQIFEPKGYTITVAPGQTAGPFLFLNKC